MKYLKTFENYQSGPTDLYTNIINGEDFILRENDVRMKYQVKMFTTDDIEYIKSKVNSYFKIEHTHYVITLRNSFSKDSAIQDLFIVLHKYKKDNEFYFGAAIKYMDYSKIIHSVHNNTELDGSEWVKESYITTSLDEFVSKINEIEQDLFDKSKEKLVV